MTMLQLAGPPAATAFRLDKATDRAACAHVRDHRRRGAVRAFRPRRAAAHRARAARARGVARLRRRVRRACRTPARERLYVVPRLGTISPWASKATDIAKLCELPVRRVERGRLFQLTMGADLAPSDIKRIAPLLHDRMTETLLTIRRAKAVLFAAHEPRTKRVVDVLAGGRRRARASERRARPRALGGRDRIPRGAVTRRSGATRATSSS